MSEHFYVTTDDEGVEHAAMGPVTWKLAGANGPGEATRGEGAPLVLRRASALLDDLESAIFLAEPIGEVGPEDDGRVEVASARLLARTAWDTGTAARFALSCAEHVLGDAADVALPNGETLGEVIADARQALEAASPEAENRLGFLARVRAARRLHREGSSVQDVALALLVDDNAREIDAINDPAWTTAASVSDAVLAATEALRSYALPRYVHSREDVVEATGEDAPATTNAIFMTPLGPFALGTEHVSPYQPAWAAARDAAARARDVAHEHGGIEAERAERAFQAAALEQLL